jgi:predicted acyl esterase
MKAGCKKLALLAVILILVLLACGVAAFVLITRSPTQCQSLYVTMSDGTKLAVDVWLPSNLKPGQTLPTVMRGVRYWRSYALTPAGSLVNSLSNNPLTEEENPENWSRAGYALVVVDVRGSGASFYGISYEGNTAEMLASLNHPAVKAAAPQYSDVDVYAHLLMPGGVSNQWFAKSWDDFTRRLDANDVCVLVEGTETTCEQVQYLFTGVKPVDEDTEGAQLAAALAGHSDVNVYEISQAIEYRDDAWDDTERTLTPTDPSEKEQFEMLAEFFDAYLKDDAMPTPTWDITYYTLGEGVWKTTDAWPPAGFDPQRWYFAPDGALVTTAPTKEDGSDKYTVDWTATTGDATRWHTGLMRTDVIYPDRAEEDAKLLTYTSAPLETDVEITGSPIVTLYVASTETDGAFHVYLEDVAADGRVTYITEGILRAIHRRESDPGPEPHHSFERADAAPLAPGEVAELRFNLYATSVLIKKGHRIRIAVAGHDGSMFARYPAESTPVLTTQRNSAYLSHVELPIMIRE